MRKKPRLQILEDKYLLTEPTACHGYSRGTLSEKRIFMEFYPGELYHVYNRGNNRQKIFFNEQNYFYFLNKVQQFIVPYCDIFAYCLMPNHFHFLIHADTRTTATRFIGVMSKNVLSEGIRHLLSSYAQGINKQNKWTGSVFQQNTKSRPLVFGTEDYGRTCFNYIHQNPVAAMLVRKMEDWKFSSFNEYFRWSDNGICNKKLALEFLQLSRETFYEDSYRFIGNSKLENIF